MPNPIRSFRDLEVYQEALALAVRVYGVVAKLPADERYAMSSQMRRAATSVMTNIAEGYGKKRSAKDFRSYLDISIGSANEVMALLDIGERLGFVAADVATELSEAYIVLAKRITTLRENWR